MIEAVLVFLSFCVLGAATMAPSVTFGDSGEFAAAAATLGLPHAPSYPSYVVLAKAFGTALPLGNWAYRTNLLSVVCGAGALALLTDALRRLGCARWPRLAAAVGLGLCAVWRHETGVTEVFGLHLLAGALILWTCAAFAGRLLAVRACALLGLAFGLGLGNHQTLLLAAPAALAAAGPERGGRRVLLRAFAVAATLGLLGLSVYALLPLRARLKPPLDWDQPTTAARVWHVFTRKDYGSLSLTTDGSGRRGLPAVLSQAERFVGETWRQLGLWSLAALAGLFLWPAGWRLGWPFSAVWTAAFGPGFFMLGNPPFDAMTSGALERFYLAAWLGLALAAGAALDRLWRSGRAGQAAVWALGACFVAQGARAFGAWNLRGDLACYDYGRNILKTLPPRSVLFMDGGDDTFYSLAFLTQASGLRPDVELHDRGGLVFPSVYGDDFRRLDARAKEQRRASVETVYASQGRLYYSTLSPSLAGMKLSPAGLLRHPAADRPAFDAWPFYARRWRPELLAAHYRDRALVAVYPYMGAQADAAAGRLAEADARLRQARAMAGDALWLPGAVGFSEGVVGYEAAQAGDWSLAERAISAEVDLAPDDAARRNLALVRARLRGPQAPR